jgi:hypothetical protein
VSILQPIPRPSMTICITARCITHQSFPMLPHSAMTRKTAITHTQAPARHQATMHEPVIPRLLSIRSALGGLPNADIMSASSAGVRPAPRPPGPLAPCLGPVHTPRHVEIPMTRSSKRPTIYNYAEPDPQCNITNHLHQPVLHRATSHMAPTCTVVPIHSRPPLTIVC